MRIGVCADVHIGNHQLFKGRSVAGINERCAATIQSLRVMYAVAAQERVERIYIAGDLFDTSAPSPQILAAVMGVIADAAPQIETVVLKGNHDSNSPNPGDHALGPLAHVCTVVTEPVTYDHGRLLLLPFRPRPAEWLADVLDCNATSLERGMIVLSHFGIADAGTPLYMKHGGVPVETIEALCERHSLGAWLSGDWHSCKQFRRPSAPNTWIYQIGALCPTGFDNPGGDDLYGSLLVCDTERGVDSAWTTDIAIERHVIPGPRFYYSPDEPGLSPLTYIKLRPDQAYREDALQAAVEAGELGGCVLALDSEAGEAATGAGVAESFADAEVSGIDEALDTYVDKMPGLDLSTRHKVKELCRGYLQNQNSH